jgi:hypothetical protein
MLALREALRGSVGPYRAAGAFVWAGACLQAMGGLWLRDPTHLSGKRSLFESTAVASTKPW